MRWKSNKRKKNNALKCVNVENLKSLKIKKNKNLSLKNN